MNEELINVRDEDIEINFIIDGNEYVVLKSDDDNIYIGKIISVNEEYETIISVDDDEEYNKALAEYASILETELEVK